MEEIENEKLKELLTRGYGNYVYSFTGEMNPEVGTRQTYKVSLASHVDEKTKITISSNNDAILIAHGSTYVRSYTMEIPSGTKEFVFYTLITKEANNVSITISTYTGEWISPGGTDRISPKNPTIVINGPSRVFPNSAFEVYTNHTDVPNLTKKYEWSCAKFATVKDKHLWNSKIIMELCSPSAPGVYNIGVEIIGEYNFGVKFKIAETTLPIKVVDYPRDISVVPESNTLHLLPSDAGYFMIPQSTPVYYDRYEWKIPDGCVINIRNNTATIKFPQTGNYKIEVRGVINIGGKEYYSNWTSTEVKVSIISGQETFDISNSIFLKQNNDTKYNYGVMYRESPRYFLPNDAIDPVFFIRKDPNDPNYEYYYVPEKEIASIYSAIDLDPAGSCEFIYTFPGVGTPAKSITVNYDNR